MAFYEEISKYYDYIFPTGKYQINFITETTGNPPKDILDIACGTGGYSIELSKLGYLLTAVDLDKEMINITKQKANQNGITVNTFEADMLSLNQHITNKFDTIFCIGNSIVHLKDKNEISKFLKGVYDLLKPGGYAIFQIINFDRVIEKGINSLPTITNDKVDLEFERMYSYNKENERILFETILTVDDNTISNTIPLYPILSQDLIELTNEAGFINIETFGDFNFSEFNKLNSYHLILRVSKNN